MNNIQALVHTFSSEESHDFRQFLQRRRHKSVRKDVELYDIFRSSLDVSSEEILDKLYGSDSPKSKNSYHSLRKRLFADLNSFIYLRFVENDNSGGAIIDKQLAFVVHLLEHKMLKMAWKQLLKSEAQAIEADQNHQLVRIYDTMIKHYNSALADKTIAQIVKKRVEANRLFQEEEMLAMISSVVNQELEQIRIEGKDINLQVITDKLIEKFGLTNALFDRPKLLYDFVFLTRTVVLGTKDYNSLEGFFLNSYKRLARSGYFEKHITKHLHILYALSHTLYRTKKFDLALEYLQVMDGVLQKAKTSGFRQYHPKYLLLKSACFNFKGSLHTSIEILEEFMQLNYLSKDDELNATLNLAVYHFENEDVKAANRVILTIPHTDNWLEKNMGVEWRLKKSMIEVIFQYELTNYELAYDRIISMERTFRDLFKTKKFEKLVTFLKLLKQIINQIGQVESEAFHEKVEGSFEWVGVAYEDLQEMSYYAWLKAKMQRRKFYDVLLELMSQMRD